jgi:hypothetical protein
MRSGRTAAVVAGRSRIAYLAACVVEMKTMIRVPVPTACSAQDNLPSQNWPQVPNSVLEVSRRRAKNRGRSRPSPRGNLSLLVVTLGRLKPQLISMHLAELSGRARNC